MLAPSSPVYRIKASKHPWAGKNLFCSTDRVAAPPFSSPGDCSWFYSFKTLAHRIQKNTQILPRSLPSSLHLLASPSRSLHPSQRSYYFESAVGRGRPQSLTLERAVTRFDFLLQNVSRKTSGALRSFPPLSHDEGRAEGGSQETGERAKARGNKNQKREGDWWVSGKESEKKTWIKNGGGRWVEDGSGKRLGKGSESEDRRRGHLLSAVRGEWERRLVRCPPIVKREGAAGDLCVGAAPALAPRGQSEKRRRRTLLLGNNDTRSWEAWKEKEKKKTSDREDFAWRQLCCSSHHLF